MLLDDIIIRFSEKFLLQRLGNDFEKKFIKSISQKAYGSFSYKQIEIVSKILLNNFYLIEKEVNKNDITSPRFANPPYHSEIINDISIEHKTRNLYHCYGKCFKYIYEDVLKNKKFSNILSIENSVHHITIPFFEKNNFLKGISSKYNLSIDEHTEKQLINAEPYYDIAIEDDYIKLNSNDDQFNHIFPSVLPSTEDSIIQLSRFSKIKNIGINTNVDFSIEETIKSYNRSVINVDNIDKTLSHITNVYDEDKTFIITDVVSNFINKKTFYCDFSTISGLRYSHIEKCIKDNKHVIIIIQSNDCPYTLNTNKNKSEHVVFESLIKLANKITIFTPSDAIDVYRNTYKKDILFIKQYAEYFEYEKNISKQKLYGIYGIHSKQ